MAHVNSKLMNIVLIYGETRQIALAASCWYAKGFQRRHLSNCNTFTTVVQRDARNLRQNRGRDRDPRRPHRVVGTRISLKQIARQVLGVSQSTVLRILHKAQLYPSHV